MRIVQEYKVLTVITGVSIAGTFILILGAAISTQPVWNKAAMDKAELDVKSVGVQDALKRTANIRKTANENQVPDVSYLHLATWNFDPNNLPNLDFRKTYGTLTTTKNVPVYAATFQCIGYLRDGVLHSQYNYQGRSDVIFEENACLNFYQDMRQIQGNQVTPP